MKRINFVIHKLTRTATHVMPLAALVGILGVPANVQAQVPQTTVKIPALNCTLEAISWSTGTQVETPGGQNTPPLMGPYTLVKDVQDNCGALLFLRTLPSPGQIVPAMTITQTVGSSTILTIQLKNVRLSHYVLAWNAPTSCTPQPAGLPPNCTGGSLAESISVSYEAISITKGFGLGQLCWNAATNTASCP
jgi:hypothetical protein